jgi:hypothetical protein
VISKKETRALNLTGIMMGGRDVKHVKEMKLVGFASDAKLTWGAKIGALAKMQG